MEIYSEQMERLESVDLTLGWLKDAVRTVHHEAVEGVQGSWHHEVIAEYPNGGKDVKRVIDIPGVEAKEAWDEEVPIQIYVPYTQEELAQREEAANKPTFEERLSDLETKLGNVLTLLQSLTDMTNKGSET